MFNRIVEMIPTKAQLEAKAKADAKALKDQEKAIEDAKRIAEEDAARAALPPISALLINTYYELHGSHLRIEITDTDMFVNDNEIGIRFNLSDEQQDELIDNVRAWQETRVKVATSKALHDFTANAKKAK